MISLMNDEKHYITLNNYLRFRFNKKVAKIALNGNFSCPNRDGTISNRGCLFCSPSGSGDFAGNKNQTIIEQFEEIKNLMVKKWSDTFYIAYFQANTNTYAPLPILKNLFQQVVSYNTVLNNQIKILSIATRPDCLPDEVISYLQTLNEEIEVWVELGFQTIHEDTAQMLNRGYTNDCFVDAVMRLRQAKLTTIVHIINGLPGETCEMMVDTAHFLNQLPIDGIKIHMLHVMEDTPLAKIYNDTPFKLLSMEEYVATCVKQLRYLNPTIVIHRITGDAPKEKLIAPNWTLKKFVVINEIDKLMRINNFWQGDLCMSGKEPSSVQNR